MRRSKEHNYLDGCLTVKQAADCLRIHERTLRRIVADGQIDFFKIRVTIQIPPEAIELYIQNQKKKARLDCGIPECLWVIDENKGDL